MPERLGDFELIALLGEGGAGTVYSARKTGAHQGSIVALKVLRADLELTPREHMRFLEEASRMRRVDHPSIVAVLEAGTLPDGRPFLTMPRLTGETLGERLARGALDQGDALRWFDEVAAAVTTIHEAGLVHRDLKPENVFLTAEGRAVLLDLGIAREIAASNGTTTTEGKTRGTPAYMAPERFFGAPADVRTDLYELGVLLYLMLTATLPWSEASGPAGRLHPADPETKGIALPRALVRSLLGALSTLPEKRPASVRAFADEIRLTARAPIASEASRTTEKVSVLETTPAAPARQRRGWQSWSALALVGAGTATLFFALKPGTRTPPSATTQATDLHTPASIASAPPSPIVPPRTSTSSASSAPSVMPRPAHATVAASTRRPAPSSSPPSSPSPSSSSSSEALYLDRH